MVGVAVGAVGEALGLFEGLADGASGAHSGSPAVTAIHDQSELLQ